MSEQPEKIKIPRKDIEAIFHELSKEHGLIRRDELPALLKAVPESKPDTSSGAGGSGEHSHKPGDFMSAAFREYRCPDGNCGQMHRNPNYKQDKEFFCTNCGGAYDSEDAAKEADSCPTCKTRAPAAHIPRYENIE